MELILVVCTNCSEKFRFEFSKAGGLKCLQFQLHIASDNEFNKVLTKIVLYKAIEGEDYKSTDAGHGSHWESNSGPLA